MIRHPVAGPVIFGVSSALTSLTTYFFTYILTNDWRVAAKWTIIADVVLVAYLTACSISAWRKERQDG